MTGGRPDIALRPYLSADAAVCAAIFREAIAGLAGDDYDATQQDAWAAAADDLAGFGARLAGALALVATLDGEPVGFASLKDGAVIDMLYVHPEAAGRGVAAALLDALEKLAAARGATSLTTEASDTALPVFAGRGYVPQQRNTVLRGGAWLSNTTMKKTLAASGNGRAP
jgi:putative acetyltransferase